MGPGTPRRLGSLRRAAPGRYVTPLFPAGITDPDDLDSYKAIEGHGVRFDRVLFGMLDEIAVRWGLDVARFCLAGHSGGGQFAARMLLLHPSRLTGAVVSAPGRVTLIDPGSAVAARHGQCPGPLRVDIDTAAIAAVPVLLTAGEQDVQTAELHAQNDTSQPAMAPPGSPGWPPWPATSAPTAPMSTSSSPPMQAMMASRRWRSRSASSAP